MKMINDILGKIPHSFKIIADHSFKNPRLFKSNAPDKQNAFCLLVDRGEQPFNAITNQTILEQKLSP